MFAGEVLENTGAQRAASADIEEHAVRREEPVYPRAFGQLVRQIHRQMGRQGALPEHRLRRCRECSLGQFAAQLEPKIPQHARITERAMARAADQTRAAP